MLIQVGYEYVNPDHIVEVVAHPAGNDICVILTNGREIRIARDSGEQAAEAVARVARFIMQKAGRTV